MVRPIAGGCQPGLKWFGAEPISGQLWKTDENLMRAELGPAETATHLKRRKELWEIRKNSGKTSPTTPGRPKEFAARGG